MTDASSRVDEYHRGALVTSAHPGDELAGTVVALSMSRELDIDSEVLSQLCRRASERFDIQSYATELRFGTVYITPGSEVVGVNWEESPVPHEHEALHDAVAELPESMVPVTDVVDGDESRLE